MKKHLKLKGEASDDDPKQLDALARDRARRIMDEMVSKMQSSTEALDSISEAAIKSAGKLRSEGKDYVMREGDVVHFLTSA